MTELAELQSQVQMLESIVASSQVPTAKSPSSGFATGDVAQANAELDATIKLARDLKVVQLIKNEPCFFSHKSEKVNYNVWDCALPQVRKADDLAKRNQCIICWSKGHIAPGCKSKVPVACDHCKKSGHWQPFCGWYISKACTSPSRPENVKSSQRAAAVESAMLEQVELKLANQAVQTVIEEAASSKAVVQHCSLLSGEPLGVRLNVLSTLYRRNHGSVQR
jgi:hypothetical protein